MGQRIEQPTREDDFLTREQIRYRQKLALDVFTKYQEVKELADGYAFRYPGSEAWAAKLKEYTTLRRTGGSFLTAELVFEPNQGPIWLQIRGSADAKEFIKEALSEGKPPSFMERAIKFGFRMLTSWMRVMPDFMVIGAAKCGTTSLHSYLTQHPCVAPTFKKEIYFFDRHFKRGFAWYGAHFPTFVRKYYAKQRGQKAFVTGEATPCYIFHPHAPRRVFESLPRVKPIVLLRNPVDRAYSFYNMKVASGYETLAFEEAIEREEERLSGELEKMLADENYFSFNRQNYSYLARGVYVEQLKNWMNFFPKDQILILASEDFHRDPSKTFKQVTAFLNLPDWEPKEYTKYNAIPAPKMETTTRKRLIKYFEPHNQRLYEFLGVNLGWDR
jgi:hypothetical protein